MSESTIVKLPHSGKHMPWLIYTCTCNHLGHNYVISGEPGSAESPLIISYENKYESLFSQTVIYYVHERDFMLSSFENNYTGVVSAFNSTKRYLDDLLSDNPYF